MKNIEECAINTVSETVLTPMINLNHISSYFFFFTNISLLFVCVCNIYNQLTLYMKNKIMTSNLSKCVCLCATKYLKYGI
jgi:hypothetical protein